MTAQFTHTPYDGSAEPFAIGLRQLNLADWIEVDGALFRYLDEKERLWRDARERVFVATEASLPAQQEVLRLVAEHLPERFPEIYQRDGDQMAVGTDREADLGDPAVPSLFTAARLVQEDLVVMERAPDGWRLTAASLSFPSSWSLLEKFDRPLETIHATVPGFGAGTRNAELISRMFDNLRPDRHVWRLNWSIYQDGELHHPAAKNGGDGPLVDIFDPLSTFIRVEKQTLRRLPETGGMLFTIRIFVDPLGALVEHGDGPRLAAGLAAQLRALSEEQAAYKGLTGRRNALVAALERLETVGG